MQSRERARDAHEQKFSQRLEMLLELDSLVWRWGEVPKCRSQNWLAWRSAAWAAPPSVQKDRGMGGSGSEEPVSTPRHPHRDWRKALVTLHSGRSCQDTPVPLCSTAGTGPARQQGGKREKWEPKDMGWQGLTSRDAGSPPFSHRSPWGHSPLSAPWPAVASARSSPSGTCPPHPRSASSPARC